MLVASTFRVHSLLMIDEDAGSGLLALNDESTVYGRVSQVGDEYMNKFVKGFSLSQGEEVDTNIDDRTVDRAFHHYRLSHLFATSGDAVNSDPTLRARDRDSISLARSPYCHPQLPLSSRGHQRICRTSIATFLPGSFSFEQQAVALSPCPGGGCPTTASAAHSLP